MAEDPKPESTPAPDSSAPDSSAPARGSARAWAKILLPLFAFGVMLAWSNIPPYRAHIKKEKRDTFVWHWRLYHQGGANVCEIRYYDMDEGGAPIKRWELLGFERPGEMPDKLARVNHNQLESAYGKVCRTLRKQRGTRANVEAEARCGLGRGWKKVEDRKRNVCDRSTRKRTKVKAKSKKRKPASKK